MHREKPAFNAGEWTYEKGKRRLSGGTMNEKESRHPMPGNGQKKKGTPPLRRHNERKRGSGLKTREQNEEKTVRRCP